MKNFRYKWETITIIIGMVLVGIGFLCDRQIGDYSTTKTFKCKLIKKIPAEHYHKSRVYNDFIFVLRDEKGRPFDIEVSPTTFTIHEEGEYINFNLKESDIVNNNKLNMYDYIGSMTKIFGFIAIFVGILVSIVTFFDKE